MSLFSYPFGLAPPELFYRQQWLNHPISMLDHLPSLRSSFMMAPHLICYSHMTIRKFFYPGQYAPRASLIPYDHTDVGTSHT